MVDFSPKAVATILAVIAVLAVLGFALHFTGGPETTGNAVTGTGACVILPNQQAPVEKPGMGLVNSDHVCDAATNGCAYCLAQCELFNKIVDKYGCTEGPDCGPDGCISGTFQVTLNGAPLTMTQECGNFYVELLDGTLVPDPINTCVFDTNAMTAEYITTTCEKYFPVDSCILGVRFVYDTTEPVTAPSSVLNVDFSELDNTALFSFQEATLMVDCKGGPEALPTGLIDFNTLVLGSNLVTLPGPCPDGLRIDLFIVDEAY